MWHFNCICKKLLKLYSDQLYVIKYCMGSYIDFTHNCICKELLSSNLEFKFCMSDKHKKCSLCCRPFNTHKMKCTKKCLCVSDHPINCKHHFLKKHKCSCRTSGPTTCQNYFYKFGQSRKYDHECCCDMYGSEMCKRIYKKKYNKKHEHNCSCKINRFEKCLNNGYVHKCSCKEFGNNKCHKTSCIRKNNPYMKFSIEDMFGIK